jgi:hypothetical protein
MTTPTTNQEIDWVPITPEEKEIITTQNSKATPSPKLFTLKDDGNNADGHFAQLDRNAVIAGARDSVAFLKSLGFAKP